MSLQSLVSGSECAVASNPLSQVLKHTEGDRTLQQDRVVGSSSSRLQHLPGTASVQASEHDISMARQFFGGQQELTSLPMLPPPSYRPELPHSHGQGSLSDIHGAWDKNAPQIVYRQGSMHASWAAEFGTVQEPSSSGDSVQRPTPQNQDMQLAPRTFSYNHTVPMNVHSFPTSSFFHSFTRVSQPLDNGKGKAREADFEAAFAQAVASLHIDSENSSKIVAVDDDAISQETSDVKPDSDVSEVWDQIQANAPLQQEDIAKWENEFNQLMNAQRDELEDDYGSVMQDIWENGLGDYTLPDSKLDEDGYPNVGVYVFDEDNKYLNQPSERSLLNEAKNLLQQNGSLSEAALLLEAAVQKGELGEGGYETWILLGETRSMDEREVQAMRALQAGVRAADAGGANGAGMLSLAISYTNEGYDRACYLMLSRWLRARFPDFPVSEEFSKALTSHATWDTHGRLTDAFLALARQQYEQGVVDADVQIALGVLFYNTTEYDRAKDCFESALSLRPQDYVLWNRLGSCLSNGSKPEEALGAYREALSLRPTYTRAIYNVGVACMNIGAPKEAVEHFLSALALQDKSGVNQTSDQLWHTLRRALVQLDRSDLAELARPENRPDLSLFREQGFDF
ncbi:TPR-like protein [Pisolithus croceorrhizus]|nr:TPR-like protein [Pisolithus croceorrhizus]